MKKFKRLTIGVTSEIFDAKGKSFELLINAYDTHAGNHFWMEKYYTYYEE